MAKKKVLFIAPYPYQEAPSQRFRFEQYFDTLKEHDIEPVLKPFLSDKGWKTLYRDGASFAKALAMLSSIIRRFFLLFTIQRYSHIFIHREASMIGPPFFEWIIAKVLRRKFIYDFDDAIWLPNYSAANAKFQRLKMYGKVKKIIRWADHVQAGNEFLATYARQFNKKVVVVPTTVDTKHVHCIEGNPDQEPLVIGWTGSHTTSVYLEFLLPVLDKLVKEYKFEFHVISNHHPDFEREYLRYIKWNRETEISDLAKFNIGVMPLADTQWAKGKCGFKGLQYMALRIPAILSPVGVNKTIIKHKVNGFMSATPEEWEKSLRRLLENPELRQEIGDRGRKTVEDHYSVKAYKNHYLKLFNS